MKYFFKKVVVQLLEFEARRVIKRYKPRIVAVVGSVGKTSTKDAIATALASTYAVGKSKKSYNSEFGVPLAILGSSSGGTSVVKWAHILFEGFLLGLFDHNYPEWLVLEVGADRPGDILKTAGWLQSDVVVATAYGETPVHIEFFESKEDLVKEDKSILETLKPDGFVVVNGDDPDSRTFLNGWKGEKNIVARTQVKDADVRSIGYRLIEGETDFPEGFSLDIETKKKGTAIVSVYGVIGEQHSYAILSAVSVALYAGVSLKKATFALGYHRTPNGRMRLIEGLKHTLILDDTYNASPTAVSAALFALRNIDVKGRKIAIIGDMMELGEHSVSEHKKIGRLAATVCDVLYTVGVRSMVIANEALDAGMKAESVKHFESSKKAGNELELLIQKGDVILVKGSQSIRMERVVEEIMAHPENKKDLLVRQDEEWEGR